jgi:hypothetical protein
VLRMSQTYRLTVFPMCTGFAMARSRSFHTGRKKLICRSRLVKLSPSPKPVAVRCTNRGIGDIAKNTPVHRPHRIRMPLKIRDNLDRRVALARVNHVETQSPGNGWWILKSRIKVHDCFLASGDCKPVSFRLRKNSLASSTSVCTTGRGIFW